MLALWFHPPLKPEAQAALALRTVLDLVAEQIATLYVFSSATAGQWISRAKTMTDEHGRHFPRPGTETERLPAMLHSLYPMFTAGPLTLMLLSEVHVQRTASEMLDPLLDDKRLSRSHQLFAVRAPMLEDLGDSTEALAVYRIASRLCKNVSEQ